MTQQHDIIAWGSEQLLLVPTDTKMAEVLQEATRMQRKYPEILRRIEQDQIADGKKKKLPRVQDRRWEEAQTLPLPMEDLLRDAEVDLRATDLELEVGRPRLPPAVVYIFLCLRGCYGSVCTESSWDRFIDSMTVRYFLAPYRNGFPGRTTVLENLNAVSNETREFILNCHLLAVVGEGLDDFRKVTIDSTSVHGNSAWPTEVHLIQSFLIDAYRLGQRLDRFALPTVREWHVSRWLKELDRLEFEVNVSSSRKRPRQFKKCYRRFIAKAYQIANYLGHEYDRLDNLVTGVKAAPSRHYYLQQLWKRLEQDVKNSYILLEFTEERVLGSGNTHREEDEKIYSISDRSASFITKGNRETVFGYKIQLARSANGFITSVLVPEGNAADSDQLVPMTKQHIDRTGVVPELVSTDDGYSSAAGVQSVKALGVKDVSVSGSKGKQLTSATDWESEAYIQARSDRSAIESLMYTGKHSFEFGQFHRRGIEAVRAEMLEKVIAYNFWRSHYERRRQNEATKENQRQRLRRAA